jgi:hypothetical protein
MAVGSGGSTDSFPIQRETVVAAIIAESCRDVGAGRRRRKIFLPTREAVLCIPLPTCPTPTF